MTTINLEKAAQEFDAVSGALKERIVLCAGTGCVAQGALKIRDAIAAKIEEAGINAEIVLEKKESAKWQVQQISESKTRHNHEKRYHFGRGRRTRHPFHCSRHRHGCHRLGPLSETGGGPRHEPARRGCPFGPADRRP